MAKNTGRGSRIGAVAGRSQTQNPSTGLWSKRNATSGRFIEVKKSGGAFKGIRREK
jgi:hypothetical protein